MNWKSRGRCLVRWFGVATCVTLIAAFLYSTRRAVMWTSADLRHQAILSPGTVEFGQRPDGWVRESEKHPAQPGWSVASYGWNLPIRWWILTGRNRHGEFMVIPLWMPLLLVALPTSAFWYHDRHLVGERIRAIKRRIRPRCRQRVTLKLVALFAALHLLLLIFGFPITEDIYYFFNPFNPANPRRFGDLMELALRVLVWGTPLWAMIWARLCVRLANRLVGTIPTTSCDECGYDLSGNVSGKCPECGVLVRHAIEAKSIT